MCANEVCVKVIFYVGSSKFLFYIVLVDGNVSHLCKNGGSLQVGRDDV